MKSLLSTLVITSALVSSAAFASDAKQDWNGMKAGSAPTVAATPSSDNGMYIVGGIGYGFATKKSSDATNSYKPKKSLSLMVGLGSHVSDDFRVDGVLTFKPSTTISTKKLADSSDITGYSYSMFSLMVNSSYDFVEITDGIKVYGTAGLGIARAKINDNGTKQNKTSGIWQVGLGVTGKMSDSVSWDLGYRYNDPRFKIIGTSGTSFSSHNIVASMRVGL